MITPSTGAKYGTRGSAVATFRSANPTFQEQAVRERLRVDRGEGLRGPREVDHQAGVGAPRTVVLETVGRMRFHTGVNPGGSPGPGRFRWLLLWWVDECFGWAGAPYRAAT